MFRNTLTVLVAGVIGLSALAAPTQAAGPVASQAESVGMHYNSGVYAYGRSLGACQQEVANMRANGWHPVSGALYVYLPELEGYGFLVYMDR